MKALYRIYDRKRGATRCRKMFLSQVQVDMMMIIGLIKGYDRITDPEPVEGQVAA